MPAASFQIDTFATGAIINNLHDIASLQDPNIPYSVGDLQIQNLGPGVITIGTKNAAGNGIAEVERSILPLDSPYQLSMGSNSISLKSRWIDTTIDDTEVRVVAQAY
jgi:hypothetical protein